MIQDFNSKQNFNNKNPTEKYGLPSKWYSQTKGGAAYINMYGLEDNQDCFWIFECSGTEGQLPHLEFYDFHTYVFALRGLPCALLSLTRYAH